MGFEKYGSREKNTIQYLVEIHVKVNVPRERRPGPQGARGHHDAHGGYGGRRLEGTQELARMARAVGQEVRGLHPDEYTGKSLVEPPQKPAVEVAVKRLQEFNLVEFDGLY